MAPVESPAVAEAVAFWSGRPAGFNMFSLREMAANSGHPRTLQAEHLLGAPAVGASIDLFPRPVTVNAGDRFSVRMRIMPVHKLVPWTVSLFRGQDIEASERFQ